MRTKLSLSLGLILVLALNGGWLIQKQSALASPTVLAGSLQGGCYLATPTTCKIEVEPFTIDIAPAQTLLGFQLTANGQNIYDFGASTTNAPTDNYTPSSVALDFAASCGTTYSLQLEAQDTGDLGLVTIGQTAPFKCPTASFKHYVPLINK
ncbi:MAG: hypothetical protein HC806_02555 [Anaerolineae bacterium]|nr:hypothetical protein [Anaerolineae bacterium]